MKNIKKMLACILSVVTLGACISAIPTSADVILNDLTCTELEGAMTWDADSSKNYTYYEYDLPDDFTIQDIINDKNHTLVINGVSFKLVSVTADLKEEFIEGVASKDYFKNGQMVFNDDENKIYSLYSTFECENQDEIYKNACFQEYIGRNKDKKFIRFGNLYGNGASSPTVGESEKTLQRGDINGDGSINVLDLLQLKKYILKIIDTLE